MLRTLTGFFIAIGVTFGLFAMMSLLIQADIEFVETRKKTDISILIPREEKTMEKKVRRLPEPPKKVMEPNPIQNNESETDPVDMTFQAPQLPGLGPEPGLVDMIRPGGGSQNSEAIPVMTMQPEYPRRAKIQGVEGWVELSFTINADGTVSEPTVVDSQPKRMFDRAALRAIKRWKFKPKMVNGKAVSSSSSRYRISFTLED